MTSGTEKYYIIREEELKDLLYDHLLIDYLERFGVADYDGWDVACDKMEEDYGNNPINAVLEEFKDEGIVEETEMG